MTFTKLQQKKHREVFIEECRQKAWGARCHADWISKGIDEVMSHYLKLQEDDRKAEVDIKELETAIDYHTVENRNKRKAIQERRNDIAKQMKFLGKNIQDGQQSMHQLLQNAETNLSLAKHAEEWEWKEAEPEAQKEAEAKEPEPAV